MFWRRKPQAQPFVFQPDNSGMTGEYWPKLTSSDTGTQHMPPPRGQQLLTANPNHRVYNLKILDASSSMQPYRFAVVEAYNDSVVAFKQKILETMSPEAFDLVKLGLFSFAESTRPIHGYRPLSRVTPITFGDYQPTVPYTALYRNIRDLLDGTIQLFQEQAKKKRTLAFNLDVFTDGEDNVGGAFPEQISQLLNHIRDNYLGPHCATLTGFGVNAQAAGLAMGFDEVFNVTLTEEDVSHSIIDSGTRSGTHAITSLTQMIPPPRHL